MGVLQPLFFLILALSILVVVHEWGHYFVARRAGVRVLQFSVGFGPELFGRTIGDTRWSLCAIPFGGYAGDDARLHQRAGARRRALRLRESAAGSRVRSGDRRRDAS